MNGPDSRTQLAPAQARVEAFRTDATGARALFEAQADLPGAWQRAYSLERRRAALAKLAQRAPERPYAALRWTMGSQQVATSPIAASEQNDAAPLPAVSAGLVHLGSLHVRAAREERAHPGVLVLSLAEAAHEYPAEFARAQAAADAAPPERNALFAKAYANCGAFVVIRAGYALEAPVQLLWMYPEGLDAAIIPQVYVIAEAGSRATILERHTGEGDAWLRGHVHVEVAAGAALEYIALERLGENTRRQISRYARCAQAGEIRWHQIALGGGDIQGALRTKLDGARARGDAAIAYLGASMQRATFAVRIDHCAPRTQSSFTARAGLRDRSTGTIRSTVQAHGTASGLTRSDIAGILFARGAKLRVYPERTAQHHELRAAARVQIGAFDEAAYFYALTRGIPPRQALHMIALAFYEPALAAISSERIKDDIRLAMDDDIDAVTAGWRGPPVNGV